MKDLNREYKKAMLVKREELGAKIKGAKIMENLVLEQDALQELTQLIEDNKDIFTDTAIKLPELKSRLKAVEAKKISTTTGNLERIINAYKEASRLSVPPSCPDLAQRKCRIIDNERCTHCESLYFSEDKKNKREFQLCFYRINHYATALKYLAFSYMQGRVPNLKEAARVMEACACLEGHLITFALEGKKQNRIQHYNYISYWKSLFKGGFKLMEKDYNKALQEINDAYSFAKQSSVTFPNYFYDLNDLNNEQLFIQATQCFDNEDFDSAAEYLNKWLENSSHLPEKAEHMRFRYDNIKVRNLACCVLSTLIREKFTSNNVRQAFGALCDFAEGDVYLSPVSYALIERIKLLLDDYSFFSKYPDIYEEKMSAVKQHFPFHFDLSSLEKLFEDLHQTKPLDLLPPDIGGYFEPPDEHRLTDLKYVNNKLEVYLEGLINLFLHIADYNLQSYKRYKESEAPWVKPLPKDFDTNFEKMRLEELINIIKIVGLCRGKKKCTWESSVDSILNSCQNFMKQLTDENIKSARKIAESIIQDVISYRWLPHTIFVREQHYQYDVHRGEFYNIKADRIWGDTCWQTLELESSHPLVEGKYYFLRDNWNFRKLKSFKLRTHEYYRAYECKNYEYLHTLASNYKKNARFTDKKNGFAEWICQFPREKRRWAHKLYGQFKYYTKEDVITLFRRIYTDLLPAEHKEGAYYFGLGGKLQAKSGPHMTVYFRQANPEVSHKVCTHILELSEKKKEQKEIISLKDVKVAVFLDDFTGTGYQASKYMKDAISEYSWLQNIPVYLFFLVGFEDAIAKIKEEVSSLSGVNAAEKLTQKDKAFSKDSAMFSNDKERQEAEEFFEQFAKSFLPEGKGSLALGYGKCQALLAFPWNTPNDTLPIFWACDESFGGKKLKKCWKPLHKRYG